MLAISTYTSPPLSCQIWAVPIGAPLVLYMIAVADATEFRICADEHAPHTAATTAIDIRDLLGIFIFSSGVMVLFGRKVAYLELCPDNDRRAVLTPTRILRRNARTRVNLAADHFVGVDEVVDAARRRRLPWHVVNVELDASAGTAEASRSAGAGDVVAVRSINDAER